MVEKTELRTEIEYLRKTNDGLLQSLNELISLKDATHNILTARDKAEIASLLISKVKESIKVEMAQLYFYNESKNDYELYLEEGALALAKPSRDIIDWAMKEGKPVTLPMEDGRFVTILPLSVKDYSVGILCADTSKIADTMTQQSLEVLGTLADEAAISILNTELFNKVQSQYNLLNNILDSITNGIITIDMSNKITRINRNAMAMLELSGEATIGQAYDVLPLHLRNALDEMIKETVENGFAMERQINHKLSQGPELSLAIGTSLLRDELLSIVGIIIILRDMTASKELERLRRLDQLKSEFVANVSHELKTPLTSIKAYTEALVDMATDDTQKGFLKVIEEESDRLLFLITDLLNVSKIQSGKLKLSLELVNPKSIVEEILSISKVQSAKHKIIINYADDVPDKTLLDKDRMKEVMINLMSNAIKYSPNGGKVTVSMSTFEKNLKIDVTDQGIGIPEESLPRIFDQFYRVDSSMTTEISGTGLGLTIVKGIVEAHGGIIRVESKAESGSTFTIVLPIRTEVKGGEDFKVDESFID